MLDKRAFMRDQRSVRQGLSRRIRLRTRGDSNTPVASVDPLSTAAPSPITDEQTVISGQFSLIKATQDYDEAGAVQTERAVLYFNAMFKSLVEDAYSMYVGGTYKEWKRISPVTYDGARMSLKCIIEASQ